METPFTTVHAVVVSPTRGKHGFKRSEAAATAAAAGSPEEHASAKRPKLEAADADVAMPVAAVSELVAPPCPAPSAALASLATSWSPTSDAVCYVLEMKDIPGKFDPRRADALDVPKGMVRGLSVEELRSSMLSIAVLGPSILSPTHTHTHCPPGYPSPPPPPLPSPPFPPPLRNVGSCSGVSPSHC